MGLLGRMGERISLTFPLSKPPAGVALDLRDVGPSGVSIVVGRALEELVYPVVDFRQHLNLHLGGVICVERIAEDLVVYRFHILHSVVLY